MDVVCYGSDSKWYVNGHAMMVKGTEGISNGDFGTRDRFSHVYK